MRFFLDHDIDAAVCGVLLGRGHEAWTTNEVGRALADDEDQAIYAYGKGAVLITHDRGFFNRQRARTTCRLLLLRCLEPDACDVLERHLGQVVQDLERADLGLERVSWDGAEFFAAAWK